MSTPQDCSWIWRNILKLRPLALEHIHFLIGNGKSTNLWFDPWAGPPLANSPTSPLILLSGLGPTAKVSQIIRDSTWHLPQSNHRILIDFRQSFDSSRPCNSDLEDQLFWDSIAARDVSVSIIWNSIRSSSTPVLWDSIVWNKLIPPRYSFFLWLAFHRGLYTADRLSRYGISSSLRCALCSSHDETFEHLFFDCSFSYQLLFSVLRNCGWRGTCRVWRNITHSLLFSHSRNKKYNTLLLGLAVVVHAIWQERNSRLHSNAPLPVRLKFRHCLSIVQACLSRLSRRSHRTPL